MDYVKLGIQVKNARTKQGITQAQLAEMTGYSVQHISHVETGNTKLSVELLVELANALNVSLDQLLKDSLKNRKQGSIVLEIEVKSPKEEQLIVSVIKELQKGLQDF